MRSVPCGKGISTKGIRIAFWQLAGNQRLSCGRQSKEVYHFCARGIPSEVNSRHASSSPLLDEKGELLKSPWSDHGSDGSKNGVIYGRSSGRFNRLLLDLFLDLFL
jgi:hypothetical protein